MNQSEGTYVDFEIDYSEVAGRLVECPPECGMCCLCQPEVLPDERPFFRKNHPSALVRSRGPEPYTALALKKGRGSCVFLNGRRCSVYQHRPTYCRQFPYHLYASDRLQVELDLSCRGAWTGKGASALDEARMLVSSAEGRIAEALEQSKAVYSEFYANCREAGVMADPSGLRMSVSENLGMFSDLSYLGKIMDMSQIEPIMSVRGIQPDRQPDMKGLTEVGMEAAMESMSSEDPLSVPVYCDPQWNWNMFMAVDGDIPAFAEMMNGRAREIGLSATHFENPHGLDGESHRTTARELALISAEAMENDLLRGIFREKSAVIGGGEGRRTLTNHNKMLRLYDGCTGVKTGFTKKSGRCLVTAAERDGLTLIGVTLSAPDDWDDHTKMLDYGFSLYEKRTVAEAGDISYTLPVIRGGEVVSITVRNTEVLSVVCKKGDGADTEKHIRLTRYTAAPVRCGDVLGEAIFTNGERVIGSVKLRAAEDVAAEERKHWFGR